MTAPRYNPEFGPPEPYPPQPTYSGSSFYPEVPRPVYMPPAPVVNVNVARPFNHGVHVILDLATCGFWIPVHVILWAVHRG
jgi:hypothetical protein